MNNFMNLELVLCPERLSTGRTVKTDVCLCVTVQSLPGPQWFLADGTVVRGFLGPMDLPSVCIEVSRIRTEQTTLWTRSRSLRELDPSLITSHLPILSGTGISIRMMLHTLVSF